MPAPLSPPPSTRDSDLELSRRVGIAWRELRRGAATQALRERIYGAGAGGLDLGQADALDLLVQRGGCRMGELAEAMRVDASTATRAVARLVDADLARRVDSESDRRVVVIEPTAQGLALHADVVGRAREAVGAILGEFTDDEKQQLAELLERLVASVDRFIREEP